jgi:hypothetical protein
MPRRPLDGAVVQDATTACPPRRHLTIIAGWLLFSKTARLPPALHLWAASCARLTHATCRLLLVHSDHDARFAPPSIDVLQQTAWRGEHVRPSAVLPCAGLGLLPQVAVTLLNTSRLNALLAQLGLRVSAERWDTGHKMGALKPLYADLLYAVGEHLLAGSSHWAWTDLDLVLGARLARYACLPNASMPVTVFQTSGWRSPTASGQFTMLPNARWARQLWRSSPQRSWLELERYFDFDELAFGSHLHNTTRVHAAVDGMDDIELGVPQSTPFRSRPKDQLRELRFTRGRACAGAPCTLSKPTMHKAQPTGAAPCGEESAVLNLRNSMKFAGSNKLCDELRRFSAAADADAMEWNAGCVGSIGKRRESTSQEKRSKSWFTQQNAAARAGCARGIDGAVSCAAYVWRPNFRAPV